MKVYTNGIYYHVHIYQRKEPLPWLILLHGFMGSGRVFDQLSENLSSICNPVTIDLLGHGKTGGSPNADRFSAHQQVSDIHSVIQNLQMKRPFLHGYSMGGRLAIQYAVSHPQTLSGLILESTHCGIEDQKEREKRHHIDLQRADKIENDFTAFLNTWMEMDLFSQSNENRGYSLAEMKKNRPRHLSNSLKGFGSGVMTPACTPFLTSEVKTCFLAGENDTAYVNRMNKLHKRKSNSTFYTVAGARHRVHADEPKKWLNNIEKWITEHHDKLENR